MQGVWIYILSGEQFKLTFENTQWRKVKTKATSVNTHHRRQAVLEDKCSPRVKEGKYGRQLCKNSFSCAGNWSTHTGDKPRPCAKCNKVLKMLHIWEGTCSPTLENEWNVSQTDILIHFQVWESKCPFKYANKGSCSIIFGTWVRLRGFWLRTILKIILMNNDPKMVETRHIIWEPTLPQCSLTYALTKWPQRKVFKCGPTVDQRNEI